MRRNYVVPMRWLVIYENEVQGGALNLNSTKLPRPWSPWGSSPWRENPHGGTGNRTRDLVISSQKLWPLDHEAGRLARILCWSKGHGRLSGPQYPKRGIPCTLWNPNVNFYVINTLPITNQKNRIHSSQPTSLTTILILSSRTYACAF
jgi:hypothetical protein